MVRYYIISKEGHGEYVLHTDNTLYLGYFYTNIFPFCYARKVNAMKKIEKVKNKYPNRVLEIKEVKPDFDSLNE